jgi:hypothetical protein
VNAFSRYKKRKKKNKGKQLNEKEENQRGNP